MCRFCSALPAFVFFPPFFPMFCLSYSHLSVFLLASLVFSKFCILYFVFVSPAFLFPDSFFCHLHYNCLNFEYVGSSFAWIPVLTLLPKPSHQTPIKLSNLGRADRTINHNHVTAMPFYHLKYSENNLAYSVTAWATVQGKEVEPFCSCIAKNRDWTNPTTALVMKHQLQQCVHLSTASSAWFHASKRSWRIMFWWAYKSITLNTFIGKLPSYITAMPVGRSARNFYVSGFWETLYKAP